MPRTVMLLLAALASLAAAASALGSSATAPSLYVQPNSVRPGAPVHVFGSAGSCAAGSRLTAFSSAFPEHSFGVGGLTGRVRADHTFSIHRRLRGNVVRGNYSVTARCGGGDLGVTAHVRVR
jgi:hypothetical protein